MASSVCNGRVLGLCVALVALLIAETALSQIQTRQRLASGDPDGVGGIPYAGGPQSSSSVLVPCLLTLGLVMDSTSTCVPGVVFVITSADGVVLASGQTDEQGLFAVTLPSINGLTISLPLNGVSEFPIEAGVPVLIVVP
jgi:hypothetical protein